MKSILSVIMSFSIVTSLPMGASAANVRGEQSGSTFLIWVTNPEDRAVACSGEVVANYKDFGEDKVARANVSGGAPAKANNHLLFKWPTSWATSTLRFNHNVQCS